MKILVISPSNIWVAQRLIKEARKTNVILEFRTADKIKTTEPKDFDVLYVRNPYVKSSAKYLPQVVRLAKEFKKAGKKVVDLNIANGKLGQGKWVDYQALKNAHLPIPKTQILSKKTIPKAWPFILKWIYGFKGKNVFYIDSQKQFDQTFVKYPKGELLVQEFIKAEYEYKVITVGYKALPVVLRFNIHPQTHRPDFNKFKVINVSWCHPDRSPDSSGRAEGFLKLKNYRDKGFLDSDARPTEQSFGRALARNDTIKELVKAAEKASKVLGRELSKVDILEARGKFYILEVNRFPGLDSFEKLTKYNVVREFLSYLQS